MNSHYSPNRNAQNRSTYQAGQQHNMAKQEPQQSIGMTNNSQSNQSMQAGHSFEQKHSNAQESPKKYLTIKSHGTKAAIAVAKTETINKWGTIIIEAAEKLNGNTKAFNWEQKIIVQVTQTELPVVIGALLGYLPAIEYRNHGDTNKGVVIENQGSNYFFKIFEASSKRLIVCPVPIVEAHLMGMLALSQYVKNFEEITSDSALSAIKTMCSHMVKNNAYPAPKPIGNRNTQNNRP